MRKKIKLINKIKNISLKIGLKKGKFSIKMLGLNQSKTGWWAKNARKEVSNRVRKPFLQKISLNNLLFLI